MSFIERLCMILCDFVASSLDDSSNIHSGVQTIIEQTISTFPSSKFVKRLNI